MDIKPNVVLLGLYLTSRGACILVTGQKRKGLTVCFYLGACTKAEPSLG